jgi:TatD DNase family protein
VGIGGVVTFRKASLQETVKRIPLEHIVLETDAPYLAPVPHRGERNESAYLPLVAAKVAELKGIPYAEVEASTTANARQLYRL